MKKELAILLLFFGLLHVVNSYGQCGVSDFCNANTGLYSNNLASDIAYDNIGSGYHSTFIKEPDGEWKVWGEQMANNGLGNVLSPVNFNSTNYPALTGTIYKMGIGSAGIYEVQLIVLTSDGLFALGEEGVVLSSNLTSSRTFQKITVNGKQDGLPVGVSPQDVKMLFVSTATIIITTCTGEVYVLSSNAAVRGNGGTGSAMIWSQVMENSTTPLTSVIVARGDFQIGFALKQNGTLFTWGTGTYLGDSSSAQTRNYATQMTLPAGISAVKMIQAGCSNGSSYYYEVLGTDKKIYSLGNNSDGQLGDRTSIERKVWVNAKNPDNSIITDAEWISTNEHDYLNSGLAVLRTGGILYTGGSNETYMVGADLWGGVNYLQIPNGINATDVITYVEVGGHTSALIKVGSTRYGYVGHRINGSMGDGTASSNTQTSYDFISPPIIAVCGTPCDQPTLTSNSFICEGGNALFQISGTPGSIITYTLNNGTNQTATIGANGTIVITVAGVTISQTINLNFILGATGSCSNALSLSATVQVAENGVVPVFNQVPSICIGEVLSPLPTTSLNGIVGSWSPAINNTQTTVYTFTPANSVCSSTTTMTIAILPPGTVVTFTPIPSICLGETLNPLPTISTNGILGVWSPAPNSLQTTTYTFTPTSSLQCSIGTTMTIGVNSNSVPTFTPIDPICEGDVLTPLPTTSIEGISGTWSPALNNLQTTTYTFTPNTPNCVAIAQMTIVVYQKVTPIFSQVNPICEGDSFANLPTISTNSISGTWSPAVNNLATTTYTFTPDFGFCANSTQMTVVIIPRDNPIFAPVATLCYGDSTYNLPQSSTNSINGTWTPTLDTTQSLTYTFTPNSDQCANPAILQINVFDDFNFEVTEYCKNDNFILEIVPLSNSFNIDAASCNWYVNSSTAIANGTQFNVTNYLNSTTVIEPLPITFDVVVTNANGCQKQKSVVLEIVYCGIQKGISPNSDGLNNFFDLRLLDVKKLSIFNRHGIKVYDKEDYYDEWKGQTNDGNELPDGVYYYVIDFENETSKTGWIYINRED
jgi:gliding motility-associated-like protein